MIRTDSLMKYLVRPQGVYEGVLGKGMEVGGKRLPDATAQRCLTGSATAAASPPCDGDGWRMKECMNSRPGKDMGL